MLIRQALGQASQQLAAAGIETPDVDAAELLSDLINCSHIILPGVGAYNSAMDKLNDLNITDGLLNEILIKKKPFLGICVGMQIMCEKGFEFKECKGLELIKGYVDEFEKKNDLILPHMGWNTVEAAKNSKLFKGIEHERFYFVHSYGVRNWELEAIGSFIPPKVTWTEFGTKFVSALEVGPLSATQFHPEKSGQAGIKLLSNWLGTF